MNQNINQLISKLNRRSSRIHQNIVAVENDMKFLMEKLIADEHSMEANPNT